jgi:hypothetical protein
MTVSRQLVWLAAGVCWLGAVSAGMALVMRYDTTPGAPAEAPVNWPEGTRLALATDRPTLVMLAHPRCDCTRASLAEFAELLARTQHPPRAYVVFIKPPRTDSAWEMTSLWERAQAIPGVEVVRDDDGLEARRFGVHTSGQVFLFLPDGRLAFSGGTTSARGKTGANVGRTTLLDLLDGRAALTSATPVYGCPLFGEADEPAPAAHDDHRQAADPGEEGQQR